MIRSGCRTVFLAAILSNPVGSFAESAAKPSAPAATAGPAISAYLVGNNVWHDPTDQTWQTSGRAGLKIVRIGGIEYDNHFPSFERLTEWVNHIKAIGAEPMIQVSSRRSAADAAAVVQYFNIKTKNPVKFWNIGNEPWLEGDRPENRLPLAATVAGYVKASASAMKAVDPTIKIFTPDECDYFDEMYESLLGGSSDITGKDASGHYYIDGISWHRYVGLPPANIQIDGLTTLGAEDFRVRMEKTRRRVDFVNQLHGRTGADALEWGIGEFNASDGPRVCSFENGQMYGLIYGDVMKYGGMYALTWSMYENGGSCQGTDFSFINNDGTPRSNYYHMQMVSQNMSGRFAEGRSTVAGVRAFGCVDKDRIVVMLFNIETSGQRTCTVRLDDGPVSGGDCAVNVAVGIGAELKQPIGCQTTLVLVFDRQGKLTKRITYSRALQWSAGNPPSVESLASR